MHEEWWGRVLCQSRLDWWGGIWSWRSEAPEVGGALRLLASGEALEQMLQVCEQDMAVTDEAVSDLRGWGCCLERGREEMSWPTRL